MAEPKNIRVCFPDKNSSPAEKELGVKILDRIINESEPTMEHGKSGPRIRKADKAPRPILPEVPDQAVDGHEPLLGEAPLGDEI